VAYHFASLQAFDVDQCIISLSLDSLVKLFNYGCVLIVCHRRFLQHGFMRLSSTPYDITAAMTDDQRDDFCNTIMTISQRIALPSKIPGRILMQDNLSLPVYFLARVLRRIGVNSVNMKAYGMKMSHLQFMFWMNRISLHTDGYKYGLFDFGRTFHNDDIIVVEDAYAITGYHKTFYEMFRTNISGVKIGGLELRRSTVSNGIQRIKLYSHLVHTLKSMLKVHCLESGCIRLGYSYSFFFRSTHCSPMMRHVLTAG
jgi:hypothetical protein